ncbi:hypothetical protein N8702_00595 [Verrucomicrobia bacterium]|nr:hypothetical protein [Verrucomicrobiota bacterium]MDA7660183.1 hypothetical protein [Verrucomicrobiota bacterium]
MKQYSAKACGIVVIVGNFNQVWLHRIEPVSLKIMKNHYIILKREGRVFAGLIMVQLLLNWQ